MAEIEPASDEIVAAANAGVRHGIDFPHENLAAILARLRKAETDNANMVRLLSGYARICSEAGIAPSSSEIYAAAERAGGGDALKPTWFADADNWEFTTDDLSHITDDLSWNDSVRVLRLVELPCKWVARIPIDTDGDGEADDSEIQWFDTEEECRRATQGGGNG